MAGCLKKFISDPLKRDEASSDYARRVIQNITYKASKSAATTNRIPVLKTAVE